MTYFQYLKESIYYSFLDFLLELILWLFFDGPTPGIRISMKYPIEESSVDTKEPSVTISEKFIKQLLDNAENQTNEPPSTLILNKDNSEIDPIANHADYATLNFIINSIFILICLMLIKKYWRRILALPYNLFKVSLKRIRRSTQFKEIQS